MMADGFMVIQREAADGLQLPLLFDVCRQCFSFIKSTASSVMSLTAITLFELQRRVRMEIHIRQMVEWKEER